MAELVLKVGDSDNPQGYKDGDVLCAFNRKRIRSCHAEMICHVKHVEFNSDGLNPDDCISVHWFENTHEFRFQRVSLTEVIRTNLFTDEIDLIGPNANAKGEHMDVPRFIERRMRHERHRIFGMRDFEFWYGGSIVLEHPKLDVVWQKIEEMKALKEVDHTLWPLTPIEKKHFLALPTDDFQDEVRHEYESPVLDIDGEKILLKRKHSVTYPSLLDAGKLQEVLNKATEVDVRKDMAPLQTDLIVQVKAAATSVEAGV